jgi:hypothetical protein
MIFFFQLTSIFAILLELHFLVFPKRARQLIAYKTQKFNQILSYQTKEEQSFMFEKLVKNDPLIRLFNLFVLLDTLYLIWLILAIILLPQPYYLYLLGIAGLTLIKFILKKILPMKYYSFYSRIDSIITLGLLSTLWIL